MATNFHLCRWETLEREDFVLWRSAATLSLNGYSKQWDRVQPVEQVCPRLDVCIAPATGAMSGSGITPAAAGGA